MSGARWMKVDLHMHAPGVGQYYTLPNGYPPPETPEAKTEFARLYVQNAHERAGLDMIAITNHNDTSWIDPLRAAAKALYGDNFVVLPGLEIGSDSGRNSIHLLAIFPQDAEVELLERLLDDDLSLTRAKRFTSTGAVLASPRSFTDVAAAIVERDSRALVIAAHVLSSEDSLLDSSSNRGESRMAQFMCPDLHGLDLAAYTLHQLAAKQNKWEFLVVTNQYADKECRRNIPIALLNNSDARKLDDIGARYTWIKGERPCFDALRSALLNPEDRVRLKDAPPTEASFWAITPKWIYTPPSSPAQHIDRLTVADTNTGFLRNVCVEFHPGLTSLIGGRGSGKSAVIELLRYLWDHTPVEKQFDGFQDVFLPESAQASVEITVDSSKYKISRLGRLPPVVETLTHGAWQAIDGLKPDQLIALQVYGQKEILHTSKDIHSQLELLDRLCGEPLSALKATRNNILEQLQQNREQIMAAHREVIALDRELEALPQVQDQLRRCHEQGIEEKAAAKDAYEHESQLWQAAATYFDTVNKSLENAVSVLRPSLPELGNDRIESLTNAPFFRAVNTKLSKFHETLAQGLGLLMVQLSDQKSEVESIKGPWQTQFDQALADYREALLTLPGVTPDEIVRLDRRRQELQKKQALRDTKIEIVVALANTRKDLLNSLIENAHKQFELRDAKAKDISSRTTRVRISVVANGDRAALSGKWHHFLSGSRLRDTNYAALDSASSESVLPVLALVEQADTDTPAEFRCYAAWLPPDLDTSSSPFRQLQSFVKLQTDDNAQKLLIHMGLEQRLQLDEFVVPDTVHIELNIADEGKPDTWRALGRGVGRGVSVGQGCTAILSILLLQSEAPLIIDQPEDDLDNRFIYGEVVQLLRRERGSRQIIVATHNANIPVAGDAELIVALDAEAPTDSDEGDLRCTVRAAGFIDQTAVRDQVALVLEGGEEALKRRFLKYGF